MTPFEIPGPAQAADVAAEFDPRCLEVKRPTFSGRPSSGAGGGGVREGRIMTADTRPRLRARHPYSHVESATTARDRSTWVSPAARPARPFRGPQLRLRPICCGLPGRRPRRWPTQAPACPSVRQPQRPSKPLIPRPVTSVSMTLSRTCTSFRRSRRQRSRPGYDESSGAGAVLRRAWPRPKLSCPVGGIRSLRPIMRK